MPSLFVLPRQVPLSSSAGLFAGAKLTFSATGSSTLQNTYSDLALTTPNANPVVADGNGVFGAIYLDPTLPAYRVKLTTSADVLIYQQDDIPSNQNTAQTFRLKAAAPELLFEETDASAGNKKWSIKVNGEVLSIDLLDDAESTRTNVATLARTGVANFAAGALFVASKRAATTDAASFTATLTGMGSTVTGTVQYEVSGQHTILQALAAISGTSNATSFTLTGLPAAARPAGDVFVPCILTNNGTTVAGAAFIAGTTTTITFYMGSPLSATGFTNSGTKGLPSGWSLVFPRNSL